MHEDVWNGAAEYQNGHRHFGSRQPTALNSREQPATVVLSMAVVCKKSKKKRTRSLVLRSAIAQIAYLDSLVASHRQDYCSCLQEEDLGSDWAIPKE